MNNKIKGWKSLVTKGLCNGLSHTYRDGRINDIEWVRKRLALWESFGRCIYALHNNQDYKSDEKTLKEVAEEGYK